MLKRKVILFPNKGSYTVKNINTTQERSKFYCTQGIYAGRSVQVIFREGERAIIRCGKTKIALAGKAMEELELK